MKSITEIDKNFKVETEIQRDGLVFFDPDQAPFKIYGVFKEDGAYRRMPKAVAEQISEGVLGLHANAAGGRIRFITDSPYVVVKVKMGTWKMAHFALTGSAGFDMFAEYNGKHRYAGSFVPPFAFKSEYEAVKDFDLEYAEDNTCEKIITLNMPLYSTVVSLYIGLKEGSVLKEAPNYSNEKPVVYYGSSITQGGCASKPGSCYQNILSRRFNQDYINLGFSGSAKAEDAMIDYIKGLDMSIFVYDYDHNAPNIEHLRATHSKMFKAIREAHPQLPILILPRPRFYLTPDDRKRFEIIHNTYLEAKANGDENVYFLTGKELMALVEDNGSVDGTHPTDSGFHSMAQAIGKVFEEILSKKGIK